jgi:hypothetical protein
MLIKVNHEGEFVRLLPIVITLVLLLTACQRYNIGAENAAPRVVSGASNTRTLGLSAEAAEATPADGATLPEVESARLVVQEAFGSVRGTRAARLEMSERLAASRDALQAVYESDHWPELGEGFAVAIEKVREGTNDAPNALERLLHHLED